MKKSKQVQVVRVNPYRKGLTHDIFGYWMKKESATIKELINYAMEECGKEYKQADAVVRALLSPRLSCKGDPRGSYSVRGDLHYAFKLGRKVKAGIKDAQSYMLCWRKKPLERKYRNDQVRVDQEKHLKAVNLVVKNVDRKEKV